MCCIVNEAVRMHTVNGRRCEVKKALPRDDTALTSSSHGGSSEFKVI